MERLPDPLPLSLALALSERLSLLVGLSDLLALLERLSERLSDPEGEAVGVNPVVTVAVAL